jgi:hypothetical protein
MNGENDIICRQEQRFGKFLRWFLLADGLFFIILMAGLQLFLRHSSQKLIPMPILAVIITISAAVMILFWNAKLLTEIRSDGLYIRFFPFHLGFKRFAFEDFAEYYAREYSPIGEYGGWGIRGSFKNGKAYNISGKLGLQIVFKNGKKLLIGSQKPEELVAAIGSVMKNNSSHP